MTCVVRINQKPTMSLFNQFSKNKENDNILSGPYNKSEINQLYQMFFCDNIDLYKENILPPFTYPYSILFNENISSYDLQKITKDDTLDTRLKVLAYRKMQHLKLPLPSKELLGVIVEVGLDNGLDVLAAYKDGTARYINYTGKILIWESTTTESLEITTDLFSKSNEILKHIGPWDKARRPNPGKDTVRISFLVSDGLYFGEGGVNVFFNDPMAKPALDAATRLMKYLTELNLNQPS